MLEERRGVGGEGGRERGRQEERVKKNTHRGPRKTNSSLRCHYLHKSDVCAHLKKKKKKKNICEALGALKGKCGNWLHGGGRRGKRGEDQWMMSLR